MVGIFKQTTNKNSGFTIVELLLATVIFSLVLLVALASFLQVSHLFYKGVSLTSTRASATQVLSDIKSNMQSGGGLSMNGSVPYNYGSPGYEYFCIGSTRYTFTTKSGIPVAANDAGGNINPANGDNLGNYGLLKDNLNGNSACSVPCISSCANPFNKPVEVLGNMMRLINITIGSASGGTNLYNVHIVVAYGDDPVLDLSNFSTQPNSVSCKGNSANQAFCAVVILDNAVYTGGGV